MQSVSGNATVQSVSGNATVKSEADSVVFLFGFAVAFLFKKARAIKKSKTATIIKPKYTNWFDANGIEKKPKIILFKRVSKDFKTQEGTENETTWTPGTSIEHKAWNPDKEECGAGKFHAVSRPYFGDEFSDATGDRYIAIEIKSKDLFEWPNPQHPHKIAFRAGKILWECDRFGEKLK